uniref:Uncharacterized protein n=1 Tax=Arundo donax TaxID=35708 RepID=A0A0A9ATH9_ARUDO
MILHVYTIGSCECIDHRDGLKFVGVVRHAVVCL